MINLAAAAQALTIILGALPVLAAPFERRFLGSNPSTAGKLTYYAITIALLWSLTAAAVWIFGVERLRDAPWPWIASLLYMPGAAALVGAILAIFFALALMPLLQSLRGPRWRRAYAKAYRRQTGAYRGILPETGVERFAFFLLSLTAGVCEEALYRGFLIRYLHEGAPALPLLAALGLSSLVFGIGHLYQGVSAVFRIGLVGVAFGALFLLSGSLIPGIILHALMDLQGAYVLRPFPDDDTAAAAA